MVLTLAYNPKLLKLTKPLQPIMTGKLYKVFENNIKPLGLMY